MSEQEERRASAGATSKQSLVVRVNDNDFQCEVLAKLARLEAKMDMLMGTGQPGRITLVENRLVELERNDLRRGVYERVVNAIIATAVSAAIAMHDRLGIK